MLKSAFKLRKSKGTKKTVKKVAKSKGLSKTVKSYVKKELAKNIENKMSVNIPFSSSILTLQTNNSSAVTINYGVFNPYDNQQFAITQGVSNNNRIGNKIKLKKWMVRGTIYADPNEIKGSAAFPMGAGYIDYYLGRKVDLTTSFTIDLEDFYQNGPASVSPEGFIQERTYSINKDVYKIYHHKRVKIGPAGVGWPNSQILPNNDYKLNHEFKFDICKYVCKNHTIKYNDEDSDPQDALLQALCVFATFTMPCYDVNQVGLQADETYYSPVRWELNSFIEYEDA